MKCLFAVAFVLFASTPFVKAEDPKKFFLEDDGSVTLRQDVATLKSEVANLKAEVAALKKSSATAKAAPAPTPAKAAPTQFKTVRTQVCTNGVCRIVDQLVPLTDLEAAALAAGSPSAGANPCPMGQCTDCQCASTGTSSGSGRTGWYLGKNLGRVK